MVTVTSTHTGQLDVDLNDAMQLFSGCPRNHSNHLLILTD